MPTMGFWDIIYSHDGLRRTFGGTVVGTVCGFSFGGVDAAKVVGLTAKDGANALNLHNIMKKLVDPKLMQAFFKHQLKVTGCFGVFFGSYQCARWALDKHYPILDDEQQTFIACAAALAPVLPTRVMRRNLPWALALVGFDWWNGSLK